MSILKVLCSTFAVWLFVSRVCCETEVQRIYVRAVQCNGSNVVHPNVSCYAKSFNRSFSGANINIFFVNPMTFMNFEVKLYYKYGLIFRDVIRTPRMDWCQVMREESGNSFMKMFIDIIRDSVPGIIHKCPYKEIVVRNIQPKARTLGSIFPAGDYKMIMYFYNQNSELGFVINMIGSIISPLKENFG